MRIRMGFVALGFFVTFAVSVFITLLKINTLTPLHPGLSIHENLRALTASFFGTAPAPPPPAPAPPPPSAPCPTCDCAPRPVAQTDPNPSLLPTSPLEAALGPALAGISAEAAQAEVFRVLAVSGLQCHAAHGADLGGTPLIWGSSHRTSSAAECCAACRAHRDAAARGALSEGTKTPVCNTWVWCANKERCGKRYQECWLNRRENLPAPKLDQPTESGPWISGSVYGDNDWLMPYEKFKYVLLHTQKGIISVRFLPHLAPTSVREIRRLAALQGSSARSGCRFYRAEPGFVLQGSIQGPGAYVATPRYPNPPQEKVMLRGMTCFAGGGGGPDFFIILGDNSGFQDKHLCWGQVAEGMDTVVAQLMQLPIRPKKPNEMSILADDVFFNMSLSVDGRV